MKLAVLAAVPLGVTTRDRPARRRSAGTTAVMRVEFSTLKLAAGVPANSDRRRAGEVRAGERHRHARAAAGRGKRDERRQAAGRAEVEVDRARVAVETIHGDVVDRARHGRERHAAGHEPAGVVVAGDCRQRVDRRAGVDRQQRVEGAARRVDRVDPGGRGVHTYQTDAPPALPAWSGSPGSLVAPTLLPCTMAEVPDKGCALAKLSFAGVGSTMKNCVLVAVRSAPSVTWIGPVVASDGHDGGDLRVRIDREGRRRAVEGHGDRPVKFVPVMMTGVPTLPLAGVKSVIVGPLRLGARLSVKLPSAGPVPSLKPSTAKW